MLDSSNVWSGNRRRPYTTARAIGGKAKISVATNAATGPNPKRIRTGTR